MTTTTTMNRDDLVFLAKLSEQAERYEEMVGYMKTLMNEYEDELTLEERNLLAVGYKNVLGARRAAWRVVGAIERKNTTESASIKRYRETIEQEVTKICSELLDLMTTKLIPTVTTNEGKVFYQKTVGDYYRYLGEVQVGEARKASAKLALEAYESAQEVAETTMAPTHPIRLGLALNFSVFYFDILSSTERACALAKDAFDNAIAELDTLTEDMYKDSTLVMQLLRDNVTLWTSMSDNENEGEGEGEGNDV